MGPGPDEAADGIDVDDGGDGRAGGDDAVGAGGSAGGGGAGGVPGQGHGVPEGRGGVDGDAALVWVERSPSGHLQCGAAIDRLSPAVTTAWRQVVDRVGFSVQ